MSERETLATMFQEIWEGTFTTDYCENEDWLAVADAALVETADLRERLARAEATLALGLSLVEITDAASEVGSDTWAWCYAARGALATSTHGAADNA